MRQEAKTISEKKLRQNVLRSTVYTCGLIAICLVNLSLAYAQESTNRVDAKTDWSVFVEDQPTKECWIVSKPTKVVNTRDGKEVSARRSDILLWVTYRPSEDINGQVSFTGGYPFDPNKLVELDVGGEKFNLFIGEAEEEREFAWPATPSDDTKIREALKRGSTAVISAQSRRGTRTKDTFSLSGFTAALAEAEKRCG